MTPVGAMLSVRDLTIATPEGVCLVENASFDIGVGEVLLLIGPSGSGKTTVVNVLCGLLDNEDRRWKISGTVTCDGREIDLAKDVSDIGGLVFQGNALFDDLTAAENLRISADHAQTWNADLAAAAASLLPDVDPDKSIASCSGGQRQRIAIARTLLANRPILIFDEPNSGLDIKSSRRLASTVKEICRKMGKPTIIVAHHVEDLLPLVDQVLLLDSAERSLRSLRADIEVIEKEMMGLDVGSGLTPPARPEETVTDAPPSAEARQSPWGRKLRRRSSIYWFVRYFREYFWVLCASPLMLAYLGVGGLILGFVSIWFGFNYHSFGGYLKSILHDETLAGIGFVQTTVAVPLIASILVIARNSAIISADLSNRVLSSQFKAMHNLSIPAPAYLVASIILNMAVGAVLLTIAAMIASSWAALQTWQWFFPDQPFGYWQENYFRRLVEAGPALVNEIGWVLAKVLLSATFGSLSAIAIGLRRKVSVVSINHAIAEAIVVGVSLTLLAHALVTILQF